MEQFTTTGFLTEQSEATQAAYTPANEKMPNREPVRLMAIGSREGVLNVIHALHRLHFAEVSEWSPLLPAPTSGEVMSILTRHISRQATKDD